MTVVVEVGLHCDALARMGVLRQGRTDRCGRNAFESGFPVVFSRVAR